MKRSNAPTVRINIWDYENRIVKQYLRQGECNSCGQCCQGRVRYSVAGLLDKNNPRQGGKATTGKGVWAEAGNNGHRMFFRMRGYTPNSEKCKYLNTDGKCSNYQDRPAICSEWPFSPQDITLFDQCSYSFTKIGEWPFENIGSSQEETDKRRKS